MKPVRRVPRVLYSVLGVVATLVVAVVGARILGSHRWTSGTRNLWERLDAARVPVQPERVDFRELEGLPAPVQRFFRATLVEGQPMVAEVRVRHRGTFNMSESADQWKPFTSDQQIVTRRPGFAWNGRIALAPGLPVYVHDAYVAGEGLLHASLLGLVSVANVGGAGDVAEGELMRFLAEAAWYPTALLPSQGVRWEAVDDRAASATLTDGSLAVTLLFTFNDAGLIETVRTEARGRMVNGTVVPTPWQGRFWNYAKRSDLTVPLDGEVAWLLPDGEKPYWRGHVADIAYLFAAGSM